MSLLSYLISKEGDACGAVFFGSGMASLWLAETIKHLPPGGFEPSYAFAPGIISFFCLITICGIKNRYQKHKLNLVKEVIEG